MISVLRDHNRLKSLARSTRKVLRSVAIYNIYTAQHVLYIFIYLLDVILVRTMSRCVFYATHDGNHPTIRLYNILEI